MINVIDQAIEDKFAMYHADCAEGIKGLPDSSVHYSIFSPPFSSLFTFSSSVNDMSNVANHAQFFAHLDFLIPELMRVTKPGRLLSFHCCNLASTKQTNGVIGLIDFRGWLIAAFQKHGWIFHSEVCIWKSAKTAMIRTKSIRLLHKQLRKDSTVSGQGVPDYLVTMRNPGENMERVTHTHETFPVDKWEQYASPVWMDINPGDTLQYRSAREDKDERHLSVLQLEVIRRGIELWTNPNDIVLSPFAGIGSEGVVSLESGRRFIGIELKESYYKQAVANLKIAASGKIRQASLFDVPTETEPEQDE